MAFIRDAGRFIVETKIEDLPNEAIRAVKWAIMDCISVSVCGAGDSAGKIAKKYISDVAAPGPCHVISMSKTTYPTMAAFANGVMSHILDADDTEWDWIGHPSAVIVPTILAMSEYVDAPGEETLLAYAIGYEIAARIGIVCGSDHYNLGWHNTSTIGAFATCAAAARLMKLSLEECEMALSICASLACGIQGNFGTHTKALHAGVAARNGIEAVLLSRNGFEGNLNIFQGLFGFCSLFGAGKEYDINAVTIAHPFTEEWRIVTPGLVIKPYPCCTSAHPTIDAMRAMKTKHRLSVNQIERIELETSTEVFANLACHVPHNDIEAKFSLEYCVARVLLDGDICIDQFLNNASQDKTVQALMRKIIYKQPVVSGFGLPQRIAIFMKDGGVIRTELEMSRAKGQADNPFTLEDLKAKCRGYLNNSLSESEIERFFNAIISLDSGSTIKDVFASLQSVGC